MKDKIGIIRAMTLDDIIENDPIAEAIYERFLTINGVKQWYFRNDGIENILKLARIHIIRASENKHPEMTLQKDFIEYTAHYFGDEFNHQDEKDTYMATYVMLQMCAALPKNLERFMDSISFIISQWWKTDSGYNETFNNLVKELHDKHLFYLIEDLTLEHTVVKDITTVDWKEITCGFLEDEIEKCVNEGETPEKQMEILTAIEARFNMDKASMSFSDFDLRDMKSFFANLKKIVSLRVKAASTAAKQEKSEANEKLKEENKNLKAENQRLKEQITQTNIEITEIKSIADDNDKKMEILVKQVEQLTAESYDRQDDEDAKTDDPGTRSRRVTSAALNAILKKVMAGQKEYTFLDEAKLISYLTNYSVNRIRTDISSAETFNSRQAEEIDKVNELFKNLNIDIQLKYQK